jgi:hypothetical protein
MWSVYSYLYCLYNAWLFLWTCLFTMEIAIVHYHRNWNLCWAALLCQFAVNNKKLTSWYQNMVCSQLPTNHVPEHRNYHGSFVMHTAFIHRQLRVHFSPAVQLALVHTRFSECWLQLLSRPCTFRKYFSTHNRVLVLKYWQFLFKYCLSVFTTNVNWHINSVFWCLLQIIITWIQIWRFTRPQSAHYQPFAEYLFLDTHWGVFSTDQGIVLHEGTIHLFFFCNSLKMVLE